MYPESTDPHGDAVPVDETSTMTLTLRVGDEAVVDTPAGPITVRAVREEPGRVRIVIVAQREWPIRRVPRRDDVARTRGNW